MITLALSLTLAGPMLVQDSDPLAPARAGQVQCAQPDRGRRTCLAMIDHVFEADGTIRTRTRTVIAPAPLIVLHSESVVTVRGDAVCQTIGGFDDARLTVDGQPADPAVAGAVLSQIAAATASLRGQEACAVAIRTGGVWMTRTTINGQRQPELDVVYIWVSPADGYQLAAPG